MTRFRVSFALAALAIAAAACHRTTAAPAAPAPAPVPSNDADAAANARRDAAARAEAARRDSIARANAMRDSIARAEAARRANEAAAASSRAALEAQVFFDYDASMLRPDAMAALDAKVPVMQSHRDLHIRIEGNTDERGSDEYNLALGQRRAAAARQYLVARGIDVNRIDVVSFGEERPACQANGESCWTRNRRDGFIITAGTISAAQLPH